MIVDRGRQTVVYSLRSWIVKAKKGAKIKITARHERAW